MSRSLLLFFSLPIVLAIVWVACVSNEGSPAEAITDGITGPTPPTANEFHLASEARVNSFTSSTQSNSCLAVNHLGETVVAWDSRRQQHGTYGVYLQRFAADGRRIGAEQQVNLYDKNMQSSPALSFDGKGQLWVAWESFEQDGSESSIVARSFSADGFVGSDEFLVNQTTKGPQNQVVVAGHPGGGVTFAWTTSATDTNPQQVVHRSFLADGSAANSESAIHSSSNHQNQPGLAIDAQGETLFVWAETGKNNRPAGIHSRASLRSPDSERLVSPAVQISPDDSRFHIEPVVSATANGFVAGWMQTNSNDYQAVAAKVKTQHGQIQVGNTFRVSPDGAHRVHGIALATESDGQVWAAWNQSADAALGQKTEVMARRLSSINNSFADSEFLKINVDSSKTHSLTSATSKSRMAFTPDGQMVLTWNGNCGGDESAVAITAWQSHERVAFESAGATTTANQIETTAKPHDPPTFNPKHRSRGRFGEDRNRQARMMSPGFVGITNTGWNPPDPTIAVGPNHVISTTNGEIAFFEKDGTETFSAPIEGGGGFWGAQGAGGFVFDPEVLWDPHTNRFFAMANERNSGSFFLLAVSDDDDDPNGSWNKYRFDVTAISDDDIDSPNMAIDDEAIYLTADFFGPNRFLIYMLDKADILAGVANPPFNDILLTGTQSYGIAMNYDAGAPATYMIRGDEFVTSSTLHLTAVTDALGTPSLTNFDIAVPTYGHPVDPVSMGTTARPELFESRFWSCVYRNGSLWAVHHQSPDSSSDVARVRWYEFDMKGWPISGDDPELVQSGDINPDASTYTFFPSIWVDANNNAAITFAKSSSTEFISMNRALRMAGDPLGEFQPFEVVRASDASYGQTRWGDYSGTMDDPFDPGVFWGVHEYAPVANSWNTWIGKYDLPYQEVLPIGRKLLDGVVTGGALDDVSGSNDQYFQLDPSPTSNLLKQKIDILLVSESPVVSPGTFGFRLEARMIGGPAGDVVQVLEFWNYTDKIWEVIDTRDASIIDDRFLAEPAGDVTRFLHPVNSELLVRISWDSPSFAGSQFTWSVDVDQAIWEINE